MSHRRGFHHRRQRALRHQPGPQHTQEERCLLRRKSALDDAAANDSAQATSRRRIANVHASLRAQDGQIIRTTRQRAPPRLFLGKEARAFSPPPGGYADFDGGCFIPASSGPKRQPSSGENDDALAVTSRAMITTDLISVRQARTGDGSGARAGPAEQWLETCTAEQLAPPRIAEEVEDVCFRIDDEGAGTSEH